MNFRISGHRTQMHIVLTDICGIWIPTKMVAIPQGGDDPCPFCNTEKWLKDVVGSVFDTKEEALVWMRKMRAKYGNKE